MLEALLAILAAIVPFVLKWIDSLDKKDIPDETEEINLFTYGKVIEAFGVHDRRLDALGLREVSRIDLDPLETRRHPQEPGRVLSGLRRVVTGAPAI